MSKEIKISPELNTVPEHIIARAGDKVNSEAEARRALWGFDVLIKEKEINPDTSLKEAIDIVKNKLEELRRTLASAKDLALSKTKDDDIDPEFHKIAEDETERLKKLLPYIEAANIEIIRMNMSGLSSDTPLRDVMDKLQASIDKIERDIDEDEIVRRNQKK